VRVCTLCVCTLCVCACARVYVQGFVKSHHKMLCSWADQLVMKGEQLGRTRQLS
jgi:hypothetical protein